MIDRTIIVCVKSWKNIVCLKICGLKNRVVLKAENMKVKNENRLFC